MSDLLNERFRHYMTGLAQLDSEHAEIVNSLHVMEQDKTATIDQLIEQTAAIVEHFRSHLKYEEELMDQVDYPYAAYHKNAHKAILTAVDKYDRTVNDIENATTESARYVAQHLLDYFLKHVDQADFQLVEFVKSLEKNGGA